MKEEEKGITDTLAPPHSGTGYVLGAPAQQHSFQVPVRSVTIYLLPLILSFFFSYFTMENHWVLKDENGIKWYHSVLDWLDNYLKV